PISRTSGQVLTACGKFQMRLYVASHEETIMLAFSNVADVLGLTSRQRLMASPFALITRIEGGLPVAALDRVARFLAPDDAQFKYRLVPKATYERRKVAHKLSADESARLARVARVWALALDI